MQAKHWIFVLIMALAITLIVWNRGRVRRKLDAPKDPPNVVPLTPEARAELERQRVEYEKWKRDNGVKGP